MLRSLLPKAHHKFSSLPLLGPIIDGFDDWLAGSGYTPGSRELAIRSVLSSKRSRPTQEQCGHWQDISRPPE